MSMNIRMTFVLYGAYCAGAIVMALPSSFRLIGGGVSGALFFLVSASAIKWASRGR
jgi:hypothetical protein